jgi:methylenetetrahydrofolate--tRNA-(uracil-5-)-methyltransferase
MGLRAALSIVADIEDRPLPPPPVDTMFGALLRYLREAQTKPFQPMNVNFGLLPEDTMRVKKKFKKARRIERGQECVRSFQRWAEEHAVRRDAPSITLSSAPQAEAVGARDH